jgi:fluoride ion exporter CrcB/FEX
MHPHVTLAPRRLMVTVVCALLAGAAGTLVRYWLTGLETFPSPRAVGVSWGQLVPWWLLAINAAGAFLATFILWGHLHQRDPNDLPRVIVITGLLGGLTSYSSLYVDLGNVWHVSALGGLLVSAGALASGLGAAALGLRWSRR